jgi:transcriptional regulator with XRE-family HTH domain
MARDTHYKNPPQADTSPMAPREMRRQEFGRNLWQLLLRRGMTQSDLARASGLGRDSISGYVRGRNLPEPKSAKAIADALGVTVEELYPGATERAIDSELPAVEMRQAAGQPGKAWLRVNRLVSYSVAAKIIALLEEEPS